MRDGNPYRCMHGDLVGHWKDGVMGEGYLFWDNQSFMKQIGLAPWVGTVKIWQAGQRPASSFETWGAYP
jgi:hypothetical protein